MAMKLSIGTAVYNLDERYLRAHIENIQKQLTQETELLLIDDCSTNNSGEVCREYAHKDSRIRYIKLEQNGGLSTVRNRTIEEAKGKWIFFADGDDLLSDYFVATALTFCDADDDIIIHERIKFTEQKAADEACGVRELIPLAEGAGKTISISCLCLDNTVVQEYRLPSRAFYHAAWGALYRREFLLQNKLLFPVGQKKAQDAVFNTQTYFYAKRISYLPYVMYYYRVNPSGITQRYSKKLSETLGSLIHRLSDCVQSLYPDEKEIEWRFLNHRVLACVLDNMRLSVFHKDNPKSKEERKSDFLAFIDQEPYQTAIRAYDPKHSGRWEWYLPIKLIQKKRFGLLNLFVGNPKAYSVLCGIVKRIAKLFG